MDIIMVPIQDRVETIIKEELNRAGISAPWNMREMHVLPDSKCVVEHTSCEGTLSESLIDHHFPRITGEIEVAHFTKPEFFESIISSGELRLYSILKRLNEQEFKPFAESHGLTGYLDEKDGESYYSMFKFFSLTESTPNKSRCSRQCVPVLPDSTYGCKA